MQRNKYIYDKNSRRDGKEEIDYFKKMRAKFEQDGIFDEESNDCDSIKSKEIDLTESNDSNDIEKAVSNEIFYFRR